MKKGVLFILLLLYFSFNFGHERYLFALSNEEDLKIVVEEYKLLKEKQTRISDHWESFNLTFAPEEILIKREKWRNVDSIKNEYKTSVKEMNNQLAPLGYRFIKKDNKYLDFYKGEKLLFSNLYHVHGLSFNSSKTSFLFVADHKGPERAYDIVILNGKVIDLPIHESLIPVGLSPSFYNDKIINFKVVKDSSKQEKFGSGSLEINKETISIYLFEYASVEASKETTPSYLNEKTIYQFDVIWHPVNETIQQFYVHNGQWVLEYMKAKTQDKKKIDSYGTVIVDGENLNEKNGYKEVFSYVFINGEPFYFYEDDSGYTKIKYSGVTLPYKYEKVMHYGCCSYAAFNPKWNDNMIWFYAIKDGYLNYIEAGIYK